MKHELHSLEANCSWELTDLPISKKAIGPKWVYKIKLKLDGTIDRYKACIVIKGYHQIMGIAFLTVFLWRQNW